MIKRMLALSALILMAMTWVLSASAQNAEDIETWKRSTWRMALHLNTPSLVPPAVQWAVFDKDPVPDFKARIKRMQTYYRGQLERAEDEARKEMARSSQMGVSWDLGFKEITGDQVYLLTSGPGVLHVLSSNTPEGKKWIATKIVRIKGKPACWCLPVGVELGKIIEVSLTEDNMFDLESVFDNTMRELDLGE